jgi:hypothetical protein
MMQILQALRLVSGRRRGSSRPIIVDTEAGLRFVKLRGAAQGTGPLVAEIIVGALADAIGLSVPARSLVYLPPAIEVDEGTGEWDDELEDLLDASVGLNLGFGYLGEVRELTPDELQSISADDRAAILWLDRFTLNLDRTARNPNLVWSNGRVWLIDHGAALGFQYDWSIVTEETPRAVRPEVEPHLFGDSVAPGDLTTWDEILAARITREVLEAAVAEVPDSFLTPLLPAQDGEDEAELLNQRRAAYVAFLWKRLAAPRTFLEKGPPAPNRDRGRRPAWLTRR